MSSGGGQFSFGTKAETLERLGRAIRRASVPRMVRLTSGELKAGNQAAIAAIKAEFAGARLAIRSSSFCEDSDSHAMAGVHHSALNVDSADDVAVAAALEEVTLSYGRHGREALAEDQVIVQEMVSDVSMSGVVFTQDMNTGAPYYVINYDDQTGRTDTVTAGGEYSNRTLYVHRESVEQLHSERFKALLGAVREIEGVTGSDAIDVEFAVGRDNSVYILQVRRITTHPNWSRDVAPKVTGAVRRIQEFVVARPRTQQAFYGNRSIFGQMPDWNPAEMIGAAPRPLALSLYRRLITDRAWRVARRQMGYAEPSGAPLMVSLCGKPYIDSRLSFHSFLPASLSVGLSDKLVNAWLDRLSEHRELHDKIEFEVATTAFTPDFDDLVAELIPGVLVAAELEEYRGKLRELTNDLLAGRRASIADELKKVRRLEECRDTVLRSASDKHSLSEVAALLDDCETLGTIPFSILARHAFIATATLRGLVRRGCLSEDEALRFRSSVQTVAGELVSDLDCLATGDTDRESFMARYGHLRPGTYDILSLRYDQRADLASGGVSPQAEESVGGHFELKGACRAAVGEVLSTSGIEVSADQLFRYMASAISAREYAKFVFTRNISDALEILAAWGAESGLSREDLSYLTIEELLEAGISARGRSLAEHLGELGARAAAEHEVTLAIHLPHLIDTPGDAAIVPLLLHRPNFVTSKRVQAACAFLDGHGTDQDLTGKVILIEGADPGFDWIFSRSIAGLITKFGGANSHMAIRCAEFGLPAAIGCGEQMFERVRAVPRVDLNCAEGRIDPVE